jgi:hypothetical protein
VGVFQVLNLHHNLLNQLRRGGGRQIVAPERRSLARRYHRAVAAFKIKT